MITRLTVDRDKPINSELMHYRDPNHEQVFHPLTIQGFLNDPINRYPYILIGVGDPINRGTFFIKLHFFGFL